jgi:hypothetical protein
MFWTPSIHIPPNMSDQVSHSYNTWGEIAIPIYPTLTFTVSDRVTNSKTTSCKHSQNLNSSQLLRERCSEWWLSSSVVFTSPHFHRGVVFLVSEDVIRTQVHKTTNYVPRDRRYRNLIMQQTAKISETILPYFGVAEGNIRTGQSKVKYDAGQNTTSLLVVIKQHVSADSEAIFRFTKC